MKKNTFKLFTTKLTSFPLWIKEVIYKEIKSNIETCLPNYNVDNSGLYQYEHPQLTFLGKNKISGNDSELTPDVISFLNSVQDGESIIEITLNNLWTLEETSKIYIECLENQYISKPNNKEVEELANYLAGNIRVGEYLKRMNVIDIDQLDAAIKKQKEEKDKGNKIGMASILINFGYITPEDINSVLLIKEESKKRFIIESQLNKL